MSSCGRARARTRPTSARGRTREMTPPTMVGLHRTSASHSGADLDGSAFRSRPDTTSHPGPARPHGSACCSGSSGKRCQLRGRVEAHIRNAALATRRGLDFDQRQLTDVDATTGHRPSCVARRPSPAGCDRNPRRQVANEPLFVRSPSQSCARFLPAQDAFSHSFVRFLPSGGGGNRTRERFLSLLREKTISRVGGRSVRDLQGRQESNPRKRVRSFQRAQGERDRLVDA